MLEIDLGVEGGVTHEATAFASGKARGSNFCLLYTSDAADECVNV